MFNIKTLAYLINDDIHEDDDDGVPKYMLCLDRRLCLIKMAHLLKGEMEQGKGGDSDEEGE
jgi:hypothetical protein